MKPFTESNSIQKSYFKCHREEEPHNNYEMLGRQTKQSNQHLLKYWGYLP